MASKLFLNGDNEPVWLNDPADVVLATVEQGAANGRFVRLDMAPFVRGGGTRPAYFDPDCVSAILPMHPAEYEALLDHPPDWLGDGDES